MINIKEESTGIFLKSQIEADALLEHIASTNGKNTVEFKNMKNILKYVMNICRRIESIGLDDNTNKTIIKYIYDIINDKVLSPISLNEDQFKDNIHIRSKRIVKYDNKIYDLQAYRFIVKHVYDHNEGIEIPIKQDIITNNYDPNLLRIVHICAGGVTIGKGFKGAILHDNVISRGYYIPKDPINIPVSLIYDNNRPYIIMDKREPTFKAISEFYNIVNINDYIKSKYDVRKYIKLGKGKTN